MSGISPIGTASIPGSSSTSSASGSSLLSSVGQSLLTTGQAPNPSAASTSAAGSAKSSYVTEFQTLQREDTAELLYASFLSPADALANGNDVLQQAAHLLGTPGQLPATASSSTSSVSAPNLPSVSSILSASDQAAQQTLDSFSNAPAGSSIIDFQA